MKSQPSKPSKRNLTNPSAEIRRGRRRPKKISLPQGSTIPPQAVIPPQAAVPQAVPIIPDRITMLPTEVNAAFEELSTSVRPTTALAYKLPFVYWEV